MLTRPQPPKPTPRPRPQPSRPRPHTWRPRTRPRFQSIYTGQLMYSEVIFIRASTSMYHLSCILYWSVGLVTLSYDLLIVKWPNKLHTSCHDNLSCLLTFNVCQYSHDTISSTSELNKLNNVFRNATVHTASGQELKLQLAYIPFLPRLHVMQTRYSDENSVSLSVCPSVRHTRDAWQNGRKIGPDFYTIRKNI